MILATTTLNLMPGRESALMPLVKALITQSRLDPGCFSYELYQKVDQPEVFLIQEEWQDLSALERHFQQPHVKRFAVDAGKLMTSSPLMRQFTTLSE